MSSSPHRTEVLEADLRAAGHAFDDVAVAPDPWQENQRRLAASRGRRARLVLAAAAAVVLIALVAGATALLGGGAEQGRGLPGHGGSSEDPFDPSYQLGAPVELESLQVAGKQVVREGVLSDTSGKGPSLCDRYVDANGSSGGCTSREPDADAASVALDWLSGSEGSGDIRGLLGGVDERVAKVQVWMSNGDETLAALKPGGWEGTKLFGFTGQADGPVPQRLVAYSDATGTVLQSVDLGDRFGAGWLPPGGRTCAGAPTGTWPQPGSGSTGGVTAGLWSGSAKVAVTGTDTVGSTCVRLGPGAVAGSTSLAGHLVVVTGPEVVLVELRSASGATVPGSSRKVAASAGSPFQVADLPVPPSDPAGYRIVALDVSGQVVDRVDVPSVSP